MLEIGSLVDGKYKILSKIGQGGMSVVYLALNERANKYWAIKEVRKDGVSNFEVVKQNLIAETDILKRLNHPHLPSIIDVIDLDDTYLIVMDYIEGKTLSDYVKGGKPQPQEKVVDWAKQICDVLGYLHSGNPPIIYRDMKPSNVMLKPDGNIMIIDFGTAREYKAASLGDTTLLGTQGYAAPEQFGGQGQTDARTDIYSLGATLYHLLTGHNPCSPPYEMYPIRQWNPALSSGLEQIVSRCTQRNPDDRYQSCAELMYALEHYDELDQEYKKRQTLQLGTFLVSAVLTVLSLAAGIGFSLNKTRTTEFYHDAGILCLVFSVVFLALTLVLFFKFDVRGIWDNRSGRNAKRTISMIQEEYDRTGKLRTDALTPDTPVILQGEDRIQAPVTEQRAPAPFAGGQETVQGMNPVDQRQEEPAPIPKRSYPFVVVKEVIWTHTDEVL